MRVVAGELRGRRIEAPPGTGTRPTTDKVREATFNALGSLDVVRDAVVIDLYAGSGALGIEALSRGAEHCTFIERDRAAIRTLRENLASLGLEDRAKVVPGDAFVFAKGVDADLVLADPPYGFDAWPELLAAVLAYRASYYLLPLSLALPAYGLIESAARRAGVASPRLASVPKRQARSWALLISVIISASFFCVS